MRVLGLDIGERRIGVAISDPSKRVATPLAVIDARSAVADPSVFGNLLRDYDDIESLVVGLPLSLDGTPGAQAGRAKETGDRICALLGLPVVFVDERLSSAEAERRMAEAGADSKKRRGSVDMVAAAVILQSYLDAESAGGSE